MSSVLLEHEGKVLPDELRTRKAPHGRCRARMMFGRRLTAPDMAERHTTNG
jgi:hypothetical protein